MDTVVARVLAYAESQPGALALVADDRRLTYGELCRPIRAGAAWLAHKGVRPGEVAALALDGPPHAVNSIRAFYALAHLGAVILPLYADTAPARRRALMDLFGARWLLTREPGEGPRIHPLAFDWESASGAGAPRGDAPGKPFLFHFSGGTTGAPKAVLFDHARFLANMLAGAREVGATGADRLVSSRPWPHLPGLRYLLRIQALGGAFVNVAFPDTRQKLEDVIRDAGATILMASPWQLRRLLASPAPAGARGPELNVLYIVGGLVSPEEIRAARETLTPNVYATYATSEAGLIAVLRPGDAPAPGNFGRLIAGMEGRVTDEQGRPAPPGTTGELSFRAPWFMDRYEGNEKATAERFREGWFHPGDLGTLDAQGRLTFRGRADDVINYGGAKIVPSDLEAVLAAHPDVADVAVVGVPHPLAGAVPVALIVPRREGTADGLPAWCSDRLDATERPAGFVRVPEIIRSADGKILRGAMVEKYGIKAH
jgi:acyl-coenzyme A synthetase/AMP-(fatty) acid ligase